MVPFLFDRLTLRDNVFVVAQFIAPLTLLEGFLTLITRYFTTSVHLSFPIAQENIRYIILKISNNKLTQFVV